jgi:hypothetical protein
VINQVAVTHHQAVAVTRVILILAVVKLRAVTHAIQAHAAAIHVKRLT